MENTHAQVSPNGDIVEVGIEPSVWQDADGNWVVTPLDTPSDPKKLAEAGWVPIIYNHPEDDEAIVDRWDFKYDYQNNHVVANPILREDIEPPKSQVDAWMKVMEGRLNEMEEKWLERTSRMDDHNNFLWERISDVHILISKIDNLTDIVGKVDVDVFTKLIDELKLEVRDLSKKVNNGNS